MFRSGIHASRSRVCALGATLVAPVLMTAPAHAGGDAPVVTMIAPTGGESIQAGAPFNVQWTATDDTFVSTIDIFYRDGAGSPWIPLALGMSNTGSYMWSVHNTPATDARVRVVATDPFSNTGEDESGDLTILQETGATVLTTLRDFLQPGSQPLGAGTFFATTACQSCHGFYDTAAEPVFLFRGTMMHNSLRDPIFQAALTVAGQDAASSGDLCLRCHTPPGWLSGRSQPTDGSATTTADREGVSCHFCHRAVDPEYAPGESPSVDQGILAGLADVPESFGNGMYVVDPQDRRRGPFADAQPPHPFQVSPFHQESELCATCHDVSNPVFQRVSGADYAPGPIDEAALDFGPDVLMPIERTYSEWKASDFVNGVYAPEFAGNKPDGIVSTCQDCHMADASAKGCYFETAPLRPDMPLHDLTGGNTWVPTILDQIYPSEVDPAALAAAALRARAMLEKAAVLDVVAGAAGDSFAAAVTVTNRTGHKLPTGYPEGRRMWVNIRGYDSGDQLVYESGAYDDATGVLTQDDEVHIWEIHLGISPDFAASIGESAGPSFHFVLNDTVYKDNRIPPQGFTNAAYDVFGGKPVDPDVAGNRYPDRQYWDSARYGLPASTEKVVTTLYYQTITKEYVEFLRDENVTNTRGDELHALWTANGRAAPVAMAVDTTFVNTVAVDDVVAQVTPLRLRTGANPFASKLLMHLELGTPQEVTLDVFDVQGRRVTRVPYGRLGGGAHRLVWDGRDARGIDAGAGVFYVRVSAGAADPLVRRVVRLR